MFTILASIFTAVAMSFTWIPHTQPLAPDNPMKASTIVMAKNGAYGSGFFISPDGYMITNNHVAKLFDDGSSPTIITNFGKEYKAKILKTDSKHDLALMKVDTADLLPYMQISKQPVLKDHKYTILGSGSRHAWVAKTIMFQGKANSTKWQLKFTPGICPGDSGSAIIDANQQVVGVASAVKTDRNNNKINSLGVPLETLQEFVK